MRRRARKRQALPPRFLGIFPFSSQVFTPSFWYLIRGDDLFLPRWGSNCDLKPFKPSIIMIRVFINELLDGFIGYSSRFRFSKTFLDVEIFQFVDT